MWSRHVPRSWNRFIIRSIRFIHWLSKMRHCDFYQEELTNRLRFSMQFTFVREYTQLLQSSVHAVNLSCAYIIWFPRKRYGTARGGLNALRNFLSAFLREENRKLKEARLCKICMDRDLAVVFLPCGHLATCIFCAPSLAYCPMCRVKIYANVRIFLS